MFICEICLFDWFFLNSANLICRSMDISKCFRGSLRLRDNDSRLYWVKHGNFTVDGLSSFLKYQDLWTTQVKTNIARPVTVAR